MAQPQAMIKKLKDIAEATQTLGLKYLSIECSIYEADAKIRLKDYSGAQAAVGTRRLCRVKIWDFARCGY